MKALSVDDKDENLYYVETVLRAAGFEVINAHNGIEALALLEREPVDLIVSDVLMPRMDGFQLCHEVHKRPNLAAVPFVFYTGTYTDDKDAELARQLGARRYLIKPIEPAALCTIFRELAEEIRARAKGPGEKAPAPASPGGDPETKERDTLEKEASYLRSHNERLSRKLEQKMEAYDALSDRLQSAFSEKVREVVGRRAAEERILDQARILDESHDAIIVCDPDGTIRYWNRGAERLYGWTSDETIGRRDRDLFVLRVPVSHYPIPQALEKGALEGEYTHTTKDGRDIIVHGRFSVVNNPDASPRAVLAFYFDITEKKALEEQFLRAQRLESIGILAGGVAHDLNNVLAPILLAIPIVRMRISDPQGIHLLDTMEASANRGAQIVRQILTFSRGMRTERVALQPRHLLKEIAEIMLETFPRDIAIDTDLPRQLWMVEADTTQMHQVFMNLCVNARDAMKGRGGALTIKAENVEIDPATAAHLPDARTGRFVKISVIDTGCGVPPELARRIFEPFFTTKEHGAGTGLGLSTTLTIVKQHEGFLGLASEVGVGSRFDVYLPALTRTEIARPASGSEPLRGQGELILVIDDEFALRHISENLLTANGYTVITAESGQKGLALLRAHQQDVSLVITDLIMPGMSGTELIPLLKGMKNGLKIIAISGNIIANQDDKAPAGVIADGFLSKPFSAEELLRLVRDVLTT